MRTRLHITTLHGIITIVTISVILTCCVPARQFEDIQKKEKTCQDENTRLKSANDSLNTGNTELKSQVDELKKQSSQLLNDTMEMGRSFQRLNDLYKELTSSYDKLLSNNEKLLAGNTEETKKLILELNQTKEDLLKKEDRLTKDSLALNEREKNLNELKENLKTKQARVDELEAVLNRTDSAVQSLKKAVNTALLGYQNNGLSVYQKNGRVYVSMEENLLFASGSTDVEKKGEEALKDLGKVLASNKDINVLVEGHTDNVPISGTLPSGAKDNWELSVLRATSVVKIILKNSSIEPLRLSASGRGPFQPVDPANTSDARKKNRRTEIILSPKLDELMKLLNQIQPQ